MTPRLPDRPSGFRTQGKRTCGGICVSAGGVAVRREREMPRCHEAGRREAIARSRACSPLAAAASGGWPGRPSRSAASAARTVGRSPTASTPANGCSRAALTISIERRRRLVETDRDRAIAPGVVEVMAAIGGEHERHPETLRRLVERSQLIAGRRRQKKDALHVRSGPPAPMMARLNSTRVR